MNHHDGRVVYSLAGGMPDATLKHIRDETLRVLEILGIECDIPEVLAKLSGVKGLTVKGKRIHYAPWLVEDYLKRNYPKRPPPQRKPGSLSLMGPYSCLNILDMESRVIRKPTVADVGTAVRLMDALGIDLYWGGFTPLIPDDVPKPMTQLAMLKATVENRRVPAGGGVAGSLREAEFMIEMGKASGRAGPHVGFQFGISPLRINPEALSLFNTLIDRGYSKDVYAFSGSMLNFGASSPYSVAASLAQGAAEGIGGAMVVELLQKQDTWPGLSIWPFDMRFTSIVFGAPETALFRALVQQFCEYLFGWGPAGEMMSLAKDVDGQAAAERMGCAMADALRGARDFAGAGMICMDELFSAEQLVIDRDIIKWVERFVCGQNFCSETTSLVDMIESGLPNATYLDQDMTVDRFRQDTWMPELFEHSTLGKWQHTGATSLRDRAREIAREKIKASTFVLDAGIQKELNRIYRKASEVLT